MKKLLFQLDTDGLASVFDTVVGFDGGADHVIPIAGVTPERALDLVDGAIYTRGPKDKKHTALFIGGSDMAAGEALLAAVRGRFFSGFRVSVMLDSNGGNTTAAAAVALLAEATPLGGKRAVVLAGTGPVGSRAAALLAREGASVRLASRARARAEAACAELGRRFGVTLEPVATPDRAATAAALAGAAIVLAAGKAGVELLGEDGWSGHPSLELVADVNTAPPAGIAGIDLMDRGTERAGKRAFGGIGIGALKLRLHRACVARLFDSNDLVLDAEEIYAIARSIG